METNIRRDAWRRLRVLAGGPNIDNWRCPGHCFNVGDRADEARLINSLMEAWPSPERAIDGIEQIADGIWGPRGQSMNDRGVMVGPVWIGHGRSDEEAHRCLIGPAWLGDVPQSASDPTTRVREIREIDPGDAPVGDAAAPEPSAGYALAKRVLDLVASATGLLVLSPLIALISIAILLDDGRPILYGHRRQTRGGRGFRCWKFRTMRRDADDIKRGLEEQNVCDGPQFYIQNDPRVTRVGKILRKYHLDELPQLWNVFVGQMSLVGPRPSPDDENQICPAWREIRLSVRPGITGLWQLRRSREPGLDFQEWIRFDTEYVQHANFWLDMRILLSTIGRVLLKPVRSA
jgi:lipopolysaccharide/colanic/teichoic acid biosynthesis glycosyltransferase